MIVKDLEIEFQTLSEQEQVDVDGGWYGCYPCYSGCYPYYDKFSFSFDFSFKFDVAPTKQKDSTPQDVVAQFAGDQGGSGGDF
ncbi:MAG: hypothetical protein ACRC2R_13655 [Xenococcaceae cyanobacterium]